MAGRVTKEEKIRIALMKRQGYSCEEIHQATGRSAGVITKVLLKEGLSRSRVNRRCWSAEDDAYLAEHFPNTDNAVLAEHFGCSVSALNARANRLGLRKDREFTSGVRRELMFQRRKEWAARGIYAPWDVMSRTEKESFRRKLSKAAKELYLAEKRRVNWGLPQKTKLRVSQQDKARVRVRGRLKKAGYLVERNASVVYYDGNTARRESLEAAAFRQHIEVRPLSSKGVSPSAPADVMARREAGGGFNYFY